MEEFLVWFLLYVFKPEQSIYKFTYCIIKIRRFKVARSDFWATISLNFERLEHLHNQSDRKSNVTGVLEKDESFEWGTFHQDLSYHSNEMTPYPILHKTE